MQGIDCVKMDLSIKILPATNDVHGGVIVDLKEPMDSEDFATLLRSSLLHWKQQGKDGVWIKLPIELVNLAETAVKVILPYFLWEFFYKLFYAWFLILQTACQVQY
ncbi:Nudix hydrolase 2 [Glycine soja]